MVKRRLKFNDVLIGDDQPTFIIAEIGINHNGDFELAKKLIQQAKKAGANAAKFQTYLTEKRVPKDSPIFEILKKCEIRFDEQAKLKKFAENEGVTFFSTPFDKESVSFLEEVGVGAYKLASFDLVNLDLIKHVAKTKKPVIASVGMADINEINSAVSLLNENHSPFALLHCVSSYPTKPEDANLKVISHLKSKFDCPVGYSDHTIGIEVPVLAVAVGATIIEKHFTLDTEMDGPDHQLSANPMTLTQMIQKIRKTEKILGSDEIKTFDCEKDILQYRRPSK